MSDGKVQGSNSVEQKQFQIQKIYLKDVSVETPNSPQIFQQEWKPEVNVQLGNTAKKLADNVHEIVTSVTVTAKLGENTAYLVEVHQAGIFTLSGFEGDELGHLVGSYCPSLLFPYAREAISDLVTKAGFPQMILAPVNFDMIYAQHQQQLNAKAPAPEKQGVH
jgi:preprotein translocase subunit SecB